MAINVIQFISAGYLKARTNVNTNVSDKMINPVIQEAQEIDVMPIIGERLYRKIEGDIENDTLTGDYETLVNRYIAPALAYRSYQRLISVAAFKVAEGNVYRSTSENAEGTTNTDLAMMQRAASQTADTYTTRLEDYLCFNNSKFPEYRQSINEEVRARNLTTFNGLSLGTEWPRLNEVKDEQEEEN